MWLFLLRASNMTAIEYGTCCSGLINVDHKVEEEHVCDLSWCGGGACRLENMLLLNHEVATDRKAVTLKYSKRMPFPFHDAWQPGRVVCSGRACIHLAASLGWHCSGFGWVWSCVPFLLFDHFWRETGTFLFVSCSYSYRCQIMSNGNAEMQPGGCA